MSEYPWYEGPWLIKTGGGGWAGWAHIGPTNEEDGVFPAIQVNGVGEDPSGKADATALIVQMLPEMAKAILDEAEHAHECLTPGDNCIACMAVKIKAIADGDSG